MVDNSVSEFFRQKNIIFFKTLDSTQSYALELTSKSKPIDKTAILTYNQSAGKGQLGAKWQTQADKNICMSIIGYPVKLKVGEQFLLSMTAALAVMRFLLQYTQKKIQIKWPNDILLDNKKICGILINNSLQGMYITSSVTGMGVNINQTAFEDGLPKASSLAIAEGKEFALDELSAELYQCYEYYYQWLNTGMHELLRSEYHANLFGIGAINRFEKKDGSVFSAEVKGVDIDGRLMLSIGNRIEKFDIREIKLLL